MTVQSQTLMQNRILAALSGEDYERLAPNLYHLALTSTHHAIIAPLGGDQYDAWHASHLGRYPDAAGIDAPTNRCPQAGPTPSALPHSNWPSQASRRGGPALGGLPRDGR